MIFDTVIEPNGAKFEQIKYANLCHLVLMSSGNLTPEGMKKAKVSDWDMFGLMSNKTTLEQIEEQEATKRNQEQKQINALADLIKSEAKAKGKASGK